jgi:hypothetical protein
MTKRADASERVAGVAEPAADETRASESPTPAGVPPKRGPGRPKGYPKTGGRQKGGKNWSHAEIVADLTPKAMRVVSTILSGKKILVAGPTGKPQWRLATMPELIRATELAMAKCLPSLAATELSGPGGKDLHPTAEPVDNRDLARAILSVLREAQTEPDPGPSSRPAQPPPVPEPETIIGEFHDPALAVKFGAIPLTELAVNESETFDNGARVTREIIPTGRVLADDPKQITRYCVYDRRDELIGKKRTFAEAAELAKRLA